MQEAVIYLSKSAGLLSLFYAAYFFLLKKDTTFKAIRFFLVAGIFTSFLLPLVEITRTIILEPTTTSNFLNTYASEIISSPAPEAFKIDWWQIAGIIYLAGLGFFLLKFLFELFSLLKFLFTHKEQKEGGFRIIQKPGLTQPFSFFNYIVLDDSQHSPAELDLILKHERSHARQWHSIDQLLTSLSLCVLWFNPLAWFYKKSVVQNLEYLADREVLKARVSKMEYQKTLLKISVGNFEPALTNHFYQSFIKKRIMMLNKKSSQKSHFWKVSLVLPFLAIFVFTFNLKTQAQVVATKQEPVIETVSISGYVTKESDESTLRAFERVFKNQGVDLKFDNLEFSEGLLTKVTASFKKESTGTSGNLTLTNAKGITPLLVQMNGDQMTLTPVDAVPNTPKGDFTIIKEKTGNGTIFKLKEKSDAPESENEENSILQKIKENPLYVIGGKEYSASELSGKFIRVNGIISSLTPEEGQSKFGKKAKDGVFIVSEGVIGEDLQEEMRRIDKEESNWNAGYMEIWKDKKPTMIKVDKTADAGEKSETKYFKQTGKTAVPVKFKNGKFEVDPDEINAIQRKVTSVEYSYQKVNPLIILNGEIKNKDFYLGSINDENIKSINVLKEKNAVEKYGEKAKNGAIEVELLNEEKDSKEVLFTAGSITFQENKNTRGKSPLILLNSKEVSKQPYQLSSVDYPSEGTAAKISDIHEVTFPDSGVMYVVDGKTMDKDFDPDKIVESIDYMIILKGSKATEKYGSKAGSWGVIEITTKKE